MREGYKHLGDRGRGGGGEGGALSVQQLLDHTNHCN